MEYGKKAGGFLQEGAENIFKKISDIAPTTTAPAPAAQTLTFHPSNDFEIRLKSELNVKRTQQQRNKFS